ncbi:ADP-ribosylglycohydrolase family protein [Ktedonobacteria bacterium brp13]|nr:ADP-ribosylglycohydrolase family protein [Ktedonobacteria bacterium brp13]
MQNASSDARREQRASGCLFGLAFGDALGADTEFLDIAAILHKYPPHGPQDLPGSLARVTDDTQMTLAVGEALLEADQPYTVRTLEDPLRDAFIAWKESPDNNRAPGITCCQACDYLACGLPWYKATIAQSKGCGANMRVAPVGLLPLGVYGLTAQTRAAIAQFQAALTHGHPTGLAAADLTAYVVADLVADGDPATLLARLLDYAHSQRTIYHDTWLTKLWERSNAKSPAEFIARGWDECIAVLERLQQALQQAHPPLDPCEATGAGWIAEEALVTSLFCFLLSPEDPVAAIRRAALSSGDSDSLACLAGAFAGAHLGVSAWPEEWFTRIEYRERLTALGQAWDC